MTGTTTSLLDTPVWHAVAGPQRGLAEVEGRAGRYLREVAPFAAVADTADPQAWDDLRTLVGPGHRAMLFGAPFEAPSGWTVELTIPCVQMVAGDVAPRAATLELVELGPRDVAEMIELVEATRPGPFSERTIELGTYLGHRVDGRLVAMAGERMRCPGFVEVSAVCTAPNHRGRGLGAALTLALVHHVRSKGDEAFLHAAADNTTAVRLYEALGFTHRRAVDVTVLRSD